MNKKNLNLFFVLFCILNIYFNSYTVIPANRDIMIFNENGTVENFDITLNNPLDSGYPIGLGSITLKLVIALYKEPSPILCTASLVENIFKHKNFFEEFCQKKPQDLFNKYKNYVRFNSLQFVTNFARDCKLLNNIYIQLTNENKNTKQTNIKLKDLSLKVGSLISRLEQKIYEELTYYLICTYVPFDRYIIKGLTGQDGKIISYLFIPYSYLNTIDKKYTHKPLRSKKSYDEPSEPIEKALGLKMNHYEDVKIDTATINNHANSDIIKSSFPKIITNNIFVEKKNLDKDVYQAWAIYLNGHGGNTELAGMNLAPFKNVLNFFNNDITTSLFFYLTCFAVSQFVDAYKKETTNEIVNLNYTIATCALADTPTNSRISINGWFWDYSRNRIIFNFENYNFTEYFKVLEQKTKKPISYIEEFSYIVNFIDSKGRISDLHNVPSIRFPGTNWFSVIDISKVLLELTNIRVIAQGTEPLIINKTIKTTKDAILLYTQNIPFELDIQKPQIDTKFPSIVSMVLGGAVSHIIKSINAKDYNLIEIFKAFFPFSVLASQRMFIIEKLIAKNNSPEIGNLGEIELNNVIVANIGIVGKEGKNFIIFRNGADKLHCALWAPAIQPPENLEVLLADCKLLPTELINFFETAKVSTGEKFTGFLYTLQGEEQISFDKIIEALEKRKKLIAQKERAIKIENMINTLKTLNMQLRSLSALI